MRFSDSLTPSDAHLSVNLPSGRPSLLVTTGHTCRNGMAYVFLLPLTAVIKGEKVDSQMVLGLGSWSVLGVTMGATIWELKDLGADCGQRL